MEFIQNETLFCSEQESCESSGNSPVHSAANFANASSVGCRVGVTDNDQRPDADLLFRSGWEHDGNIGHSPGFSYPTEVFDDNASHLSGNVSYSDDVNGNANVTASMTSWAPALPSVGERLDLRTYGETEWRGNTNKACTIRKVQ